MANMALALSYADLYRTCVDIASSKDSDIQIPTYQWFLLQFWSTSKSQSRILHTGRLNVRRMVQSRVFRKDNPDMHYTNAIYSFLKERAQFNSCCCAMVGADAKCKVSLGEPGISTAAVSRGKKVLVGCRQSMQVLDHDFSKLSLIPDAIICQDIPRMIKDDALNEESEFTEGNIETSWYRGQVYYGSKSMVVEGSMAWRCIEELCQN